MLSTADTGGRFSASRSTRPRYGSTPWRGWQGGGQPADDDWDPHLRELGEYIRLQRQLADLSLRRLAELTHVSNAYLSQIERGLHQPSLRVLRSIARALNVSADALLLQAGLIDSDDGSDDRRNRPTPRP